jgi:hypothetical protein
VVRMPSLSTLEVRKAPGDLRNAGELNCLVNTQQQWAEVSVRRQWSGIFLVDFETVTAARAGCQAPTALPLSQWRRPCGAGEDVDGGWRGCSSALTASPTSETVAGARVG